MSTPRTPAVVLGRREDGTPVLTVTTVVEVDAEELAATLAVHQVGAIERGEELPRLTADSALAIVGRAAADCARGWHTFANPPSEHAEEAAEAWATAEVGRLWPALTPETARTTD